MKRAFPYLFLLAAAGCGVTAGSTPVGFKRLDSKDKSFSLAIPNGWTSVDEQDAGFQEKMKMLDAKQPGASMALRSVTMGNIPLMAMEITEKSLGGFSPNVNVTVDNTEAATDAQKQQLLDMGLRQFMGAKGELVKGMPGGTAVRIHGPMSSGMVSYEIDQYTVFVKGKSYHITVSVPPNEGAANAGMASKIAKSFKVN